MIHGDVKVSFDPELFDWHDGSEQKGARDDMRIRIYKDGMIYLSEEIARRFAECTTMVEGKFYRAKIGVAKKAIAIKPLPPTATTGFRFRPSKAYGLASSCKSLVQSLGWELPLVLVAFWDHENKMVVGKLPCADDPPVKRRRVW